MKRDMILAAAALLGSLGVSVAPASATTTGTWVAYPGQSPIFETSVRPPINADGSSNFKYNGKGVIPVKFRLRAGLGPFVFQSIGSDGSDPTFPGTNDFSFLSFTPDAPFDFSALTDLTAAYAFTLGDCHLGALRWSVKIDLNGNGLPDDFPDDKNIFIYYGLPPDFGNTAGLNGCTPTSPGGASQSGVNLLSAPEQGVARFDVQQLGGPFYGTYADALAATAGGTLDVVRASLVLDGFVPDQVVNIMSATVNDNTFTPAPPTALAKTCNLPPADIRVTRLSPTPTGVVNAKESVQPKDDNGMFRIVDCMYMYNLSTRVASLPAGPGNYEVEAIIGGIPATGPALFDLVP